MQPIGPRRYDAFLSYNSHDRPAVNELAERLRGEGLALYLDEWELAPGRLFQRELAEALRDSKSCVVVLGRNGLAPWQKQEILVAIDRRTHDETFHVIPVLLPGSERPRRGDVAHLEFLINASWVEFLETLNDDRAFRRLVWGIRGTKPESWVEPHLEGVCPYRGLEAFRPEDARFYFGRECMTDWLMSALRREIRPKSHGVRFLAVIGPSGCGKSSVVLAGLVPKLKAGAIEGSERWPVAIVRPGDEPLTNLAAGIVHALKAPENNADPALAITLIKTLREDADGRALDVFARMALHDDPETVRFLVVVDQFEELFTYRPEDGAAQERFERDRVQYLANLLNAAGAAGGRVLVLITMRSDFLSSCATFAQLSAVFSAHQELVGPMTPAELREAIVQPAYMVGHEVEQGLVERLLADVKGQAGALPLLQFALTEVWKKRDVRRLTLRAYEELGRDDQGRPRGIEGVLEHRANEIYGSLSPSDQDLCRRIFLRLVQPGEGTEDTKRRVSYRELLPANPERAEAVRKLIYLLSERETRLITTEGTDATGGWVEVAHEALIVGWPQLRHWVDAERAGMRIHLRLTDDSKEWMNAKPEAEADFLYSAARLTIVREWAETHRDELNEIEIAFLAACEEAKRQHERKELENERRLREAAEAAAKAETEARKRAEGQAKLVIASAAAVFVALAAIGYALYDFRLRGAQRLTAARGRVDALATAETRALPLIVEELGGDRQLVRGRLEAAARSAKDDRLRLPAALALLPDDPSQADFLVTRIMSPDATPDEVLIIRDALAANGLADKAVTPALRAMDPNVTLLTDAQLRAAGALAALAPAGLIWKSLAAPIAHRLVRENPLLVGAWREVFQPIADELTPPLRTIYADRKDPEPRALAFTMLFEFATQPTNEFQPEKLAALVGDADPDQFRQLLGWLGSATNRDRAVAVLVAQIKNPARFDNELARRQARIAMTLLRLGQSDFVWPLFQHRDDPSVRTELMQNLSRFGFDPTPVIARLRSEPDVSTQRALILCLGQFPPEAIPDRETLAASFLRRYRVDPDPGVHGVVDWLLRCRWSRGADVEKVDGELSNRNVPKDRNWFVNGQRQTFAVIRGPVEFLMGSTRQSDPDPREDETQHWRRIDQPYAIATRETTLAQWTHFLSANPDVVVLWNDRHARASKVADWRRFPQFQHDVPSAHCAIGNVTWYEAARYCNWLSQKEGLTEDQWCYPKDIGPGMKLATDYLRRTGYRLPTEAEWEYACRAGSVSSRPSGGSEEWLADYGWYQANSGRTMHPVGLLKPNDFGLFDMLGNAYEWCTDAYKVYQPSNKDNHISNLKTDYDYMLQIVRGGSWDATGPYLRSAYRNKDLPTGQFTDFGFRLAKTY
jgi:formylglycine-generating enzyme required for sulfatase activity